MVKTGRMSPKALTCASCWYELVTKGDPTWNPDHYPRTVERSIAGVSYVARSAPDGIHPVYADGFFLRLPVHRLAVIRDPEEGRDSLALDRAGAVSGLTVSLEDA
jgi:hypothetical protein